MPHYVYMMCSRPGGALYTGSTNDLRRRVEQHRAKAIPGHTARYNIRRLVWFEAHPGFREAFERECRIKGWRRSWKDQLVMSINPEWRDLTADISL